MTAREKNQLKKAQRVILQSGGVLVLLFTLVACGPSAEELAAVDYAPLPGGDWEVSTPEEEGLDPALVAELYYDASKLETIYSLLIVKNGK